MVHKLINPILTRAWLRIGLAVTLLVVGLAPIGIPIVSDSTWRAAQPGPGAASVATAQPFMYQALNEAEGWTRIQRSQDGAATWQNVATIPARVSELVAVAGNEQVIYARAESSIWVSEDAGTSWSQAASLPSRPISMAVTGDKTGNLYVGTESMGLLRSTNRGQSWLELNSPAFSGGGAAAVGVTSIAINPEDQQIIYAAPGFWLGTSQARFNPTGVFASVDAGAHWSEIAPAELGVSPVEKIEAVAARPMAVVVTDAGGSRRIEMVVNDALLASLGDPDAGVRAAAARTMGVLGDRAAVPALLDHLRLETDILAGERIGEAIGRLGDPSVVPALLEGLGSEDEAMQSRSAYALGLLGSQEAVPLLARTLETGEPMAQRRAGEALAAIGTPEAIDALRAQLADSQMTSGRNAAMIGLEGAGERAVESLTQALSDSSPVVRANSAEMLGWLRAGGATPELAQALSDPEVDVRMQAGWALGEIGSLEAHEALAGALGSETQPEVRQAYEAALAGVEAPARAGSAAMPGWTAGLLAVIATIPVGKWAFMVLATAGAVFLLLSGSRRAEVRAA